MNYAELINELTNNIDAMIEYCIVHNQVFYIELAGNKKLGIDSEGVVVGKKNKVIKSIDNAQDLLGVLDETSYSSLMQKASYAKLTINIAPPPQVQQEYVEPQSNVWQFLNSLLTS